jgi:hypothetical protein
LFEKLTTVNSYNGFFALFAKAANMAQMVDWMKYLTALPMAMWLRQELPKCPLGFEEAKGSNYWFPLTGRAKRHFRNMLASRSNTVRSGKLFWGVLQGVKRGCAVVPESFVEKAMDKHRDALTQNLPSLSSEKKEEFREKFRDIWFGQGRVQEFSGKKYRVFRPREVKRRAANPGWNACMEQTRGSGGKAAMARQVIAREIDGLEGPLSPDVFWGMFETTPGEVKTSYISRACLPQVGPDWVLRRADQWLKKHGQCRAQVAEVLEPLKCRLITKGSGLPYWAAMPAQRMMWDRLQDYPQFALTGAPLDGSHLEGLLRAEERAGLKFDHWVSGDYSAATDGLSQEINQLALGEFMNSVAATAAERRVWGSVLANHEIGYGRGRDRESFQQQNGQLMGCPLSFPILCAINVAAYWVALERYMGQEYRLIDLPVLVNGDDILFRANLEFYEIWKEVVKDAGFTLSLGKNYISSTFLTVNSEGFIYKEDKPLPHRSYSLTKMGFLNTGLLLSGEAEASSIGMRPENREMPFTSKINRVISESACPRRTLLRVHRLFKSEIERHTVKGELNMHAAPELGGLGIVLPAGCDTRFTAWQRQMAGWLLRRAKASDVGNKVEEPEEGAPNDAALGRMSDMIDTNGPLGVEGRVTYQRRTRPFLKEESVVRPGRVICRHILEPVRVNEERIVKSQNCPFNYQSERNDDKGQWCIARLSSEVLTQIRAYKGERVSRPLTYELEHRRVLTSSPEAKTCRHVNYVLDSGETIPFHRIPIL